MEIEKRYCIKHDESGHSYLILTTLLEEFEAWLVWNSEMWSTCSGNYLKLPDWNGTDFDEFRIEGGLLTFTNPKIDGSSVK